MDPNLSFSDFIFGADASPWFKLALAYCAGIAGMITHYIKKAARAQTTSSFTEWFLINNVKASIAAVVSMLSGVTVAIMPMAVSSTTLWGAALTGWGIGFAADSIANNDYPTGTEIK